MAYGDDPNDGKTITIGTPMREQDGFGCPACGAFLDLGAEGLRNLTAGRGLPCCGYSPEDDERLRWIKAGRLLTRADTAPEEG